MKLIKESLNGFILIILEAVVGAFLIIDPFGFTRIVLLAFAAAIIVVGIINLFKFIFHRNDLIFSKLRLYLGLAALVLGVIVLCLALMVKELLSFAVVVYGIILLFTGIFKTIDYIGAKKFGSYVSRMMIVSAVLSVAASIVILVNPFATTLITMKVIGIWLIIQCIMDLIPLLLMRRAQKNIIPEVIDITDYNN